MTRLAQANYPRSLSEFSVAIDSDQRRHDRASQGYTQESWLCPDGHGRLDEKPLNLTPSLAVSQGNQVFRSVPLVGAPYRQDL